MEDQPKTPVESTKCIFLQTSINDQTPKLRVHINDIAIEGLPEMGTDMSIITTRNLVSTLVSLGSRYLLPRHCTPFSSKTKLEVG